STHSAGALPDPPGGRRPAARARGRGLPARGDARWVELPDTVTVDGTTLVLNGMGLREATRLRIKAYVGALYLEKPSRDAGTVIHSRQPKYVNLKVLRDIDRRNLASGWADSLRKIGGRAMEPSAENASLFQPPRP